jgi:hypothetical protein
MSWFNRPPVSRDEWDGYTEANSLLQLVPAVRVESATDGDEVPLRTYYRYLIAAMLRRTPFVGSRENFCLDTADLLSEPPPDAVIDWKQLRENEYYSLYSRCSHGIGGGGWHALPIRGTTPLEMLTWFNRTGGPTEDGIYLTGMQPGDYQILSRRLAGVVKTMIGYPWRDSIRPSWRTSDALNLAGGIWRDRAWDRTPILADALQDAGCDDDNLLAHLRNTTVDRTDGCWAVIDVILPPPPE